MSPKYGTGQSKYFYPATDILINKLNLKNDALLAEAELLFTTQRLLELQATPSLADYDFGHLKKIHHYILNWNVINKDELLQASIRSVYDTEPLFKCIRKAIEN